MKDKDKISSKYTFSLAERKKAKVLKGSELDFDNMVIPQNNKFNRL